MTSASGITPHSRIYYGWVLVWALGATTIVSYGTTQYLFGVLVVPIQQDLGWTRAEISGAFSLGLVLTGLLGVPIGRLVDRHGARVLMSAGSLLGGLSLIGLAQVHQLWQLYALWSFGIGLATALTFYPVTFTVIANWFWRRRGSALALLSLVGGLASPIFIPLEGWLVPILGWRSTVIILGLLQIGIALPLHAILVRHRPEDLGLHPDGQQTRQAEPEMEGIKLQSALRTPAFWLLTGASAVSVMAYSALLTHQIAYMIGRGYGAVFAAVVAGLIGVASLPGRYLLNILSERLGPQGLLAAALVLQAVGTVALALASSPAWLIAYVAFYGGSFGAIAPLRAGVMADHFGRQAYGAITSVQGVAVAVSGAAGPIVVGLLYDRLGGYQLALWLVVALFLVAGTAVALTPRAARVYARAPVAGAP
jgi:MFS family permease